MRIGIVGAGRIGGNCARQFAKGGHEVMLGKVPGVPQDLEAAAAHLFVSRGVRSIASHLARGVWSARLRRKEPSRCGPT
jgi:predicted dinucleotide-binding enzyme